MASLPSDLPVIDIQPRPPVSPSLLARFKSKTARTLIQDIHALWFSLTRQVMPLERPSIKSTSI